MRIERKFKIISEYLKFNSTVFENSIKKSYGDYLVPFAYDKIANQFDQMKNSINNIYDTKINSCTCIFYKSFQLPCCHIFLQRSKFLLPIYDPTLCHIRWTKVHMEKFLETFDIKNIPKMNVSPTICQKKSCKLGSFSQRMKHSSTITQKLASTSAEYVGDFYEKCKMQ